MRMGVCVCVHKCVPTSKCNVVQAYIAREDLHKSVNKLYDS